MSEFDGEINHEPTAAAKGAQAVALEQKQLGFVQKIINLAKTGLVGAVNETAGTKSGINPFTHEAPRSSEPQPKSDQTLSSTSLPEEV